MMKPIVMGLCGLLAVALSGIAIAAAPTEIKFRDLYQTDVELSQLARQLEGGRVAMLGFMAPPLKADADFFVLTKRPMSVCPFCETEAEWPEDIILVHTDGRFDVVPYNWPIRVEGLLELGTVKDPETGFVSRIRLSKASFEQLR